MTLGEGIAVAALCWLLAAPYWSAILIVWIDRRRGDRESG